MADTELVKWTTAAIAAVRAATEATEAATGSAVWTVDGGGIIGQHPMDSIVDYVYEAEARVHISLNDPQAVLDSCDADQRIIDRHKPWLNHGRFSDQYFLECDEFCSHKLGHVDEFVCCECRTETGDPLRWPCDTYRDVASGYRHQVPGWQEGWAA